MEREKEEVREAGNAETRELFVNNTEDGGGTEQMMDIEETEEEPQAKANEDSGD